MKDINVLSDFDVFFFYGQNNIEVENESDLLLGLTQPKRTLYYNRRDGCGIADKENYPNAIILTVIGRYDVANWIAYRNTQVSDGSAGSRDRRISVSQSTIDFIKDKKGNLDVIVKYIPFTDFKKPASVSVPVTTGA